jgi:hypothetical protein
LTKAAFGLRVELVDACRHRTPFATASVPAFADPTEHFSKLLPYATALGLGSEWGAAFAGAGSSTTTTPVTSPATSEVDRSGNATAGSPGRRSASPASSLGRPSLWPDWYVVPAWASGNAGSSFSRSFEKLKLELSTALG